MSWHIKERAQRSRTLKDSLLLLALLLPSLLRALPSFSAEIPANFQLQFNPAGWPSGSHQVSYQQTISKSAGETDRVYIPKGTIWFSITFYSEQNVHNGVNARLGMPPACPITYNPNHTAFHALPWKGSKFTGASPSELLDDYMHRNYDGTNRVLDASYSPYLTGGEWVYLRHIISSYDNNGPGQINLEFAVDVDAYRSWYLGASFINGVPQPAITRTGSCGVPSTPTPTPTATPTATPTPTPTPTPSIPPPVTPGTYLYYIVETGDCKDFPSSPFESGHCCLAIFQVP